MKRVSIGRGVSGPLANEPSRLRVETWETPDELAEALRGASTVEDRNAWISSHVWETETEPRESGAGRGHRLWRDTASWSACSCVAVDIDCANLKHPPGDANASPMPMPLDVVAVLAAAMQDDPEPCTPNVMHATYSGFRFWYALDEAADEPIYKRLYAGAAELAKRFIAEHAQAISEAPGGDDLGIEIDYQPATLSAIAFAPRTTVDLKGQVKVHDAEVYVSDRQPYTVAELIEAEPAANGLLDEAGAVESEPERTHTKGPDFDRSCALQSLLALGVGPATRHDTWIEVGQSLHAADPAGAWALEAWDLWSKQAPNWERGECARRWASFEADRGRGLGSLILMAREASGSGEASWDGGQAIIDAAGLSAGSSGWDVITGERAGVELGEPPRPLPSPDEAGAFADEYPDFYGRSDQGDCSRLYWAMRDDWRYVPERGIWARWVGTHWELSHANNDRFIQAAGKLMPQLVLKVRDKAIEIAETRLRAKGTSGEDLEDAMRKVRRGWSEEVNRVKGLSKVNRCAKHLRGYLLAPLEEWNRSRHMAPMACGRTYDLKTFEIRASSREDYCSHALPFMYDPRATCPLWERTIAGICAVEPGEPRFEPGDEGTADRDPGLEAFIQRAMGRSVRGTPGRVNKSFVFLIGASNCGKGVITHTLERVLGSHRVASLGFTTLAGAMGGVNTEVAQIESAAAIVVPEVPNGARWGEADLLKSLTGGDLITINEKNEKARRHRFDGMLWMCSNVMPASGRGGMDDALFERCKLVPLHNKFSDDPIHLAEGAARRNRELEEQLQDELPGIFNWIVQGAREDAVMGLGSCGRVNAAKDEYGRMEADPLFSALDEVVTPTPQGSITIGDLQHVVQVWFARNGMDPERVPRSRKFTADMQRYARQRVALNGRLKSSGGLKAPPARVMSGGGPRERYWNGIAASGLGVEYLGQNPGWGAEIG